MYFFISRTTINNVETFSVYVSNEKYVSPTSLVLMGANEPSPSATTLSNAVLIKDGIKTGKDAFNYVKKLDELQTSKNESEYIIHHSPVSVHHPDEIIDDQIMENLSSSYHLNNNTIPDLSKCDMVESKPFERETTLHDIKLIYNNEYTFGEDTGVSASKKPFLSFIKIITTDVIYLIDIRNKNKNLLYEISLENSAISWDVDMYGKIELPHLNPLNVYSISSEEWKLYNTFTSKLDDMVKDDNESRKSLENMIESNDIGVIDMLIEDYEKRIDIHQNREKSIKLEYENLISKLAYINPKGSYEINDVNVLLQKRSTGGMEFKILKNEAIIFAALLNGETFQTLFDNNLIDNNASLIYDATILGKYIHKDIPMISDVKKRAMLNRMLPNKDINGYFNS